MINVPPELRYAKTHEWVRVSGDTATIGISDHAQHELTDVVFVELPAPGRQVKAGESCAVVESVKTASDIYSPVSGQIVEVNKAVADNPALVLQNQTQRSRRTEQSPVVGILQGPDRAIELRKKNARGCTIANANRARAGLGANPKSKNRFITAQTK